MSADLDAWSYTAIFTGIGGPLGAGQAFTLELVERVLLSDAEDTPDPDSPNYYTELRRWVDSLDAENTRVREWMATHADGALYCVELDALHEDLDWLLSELSKDIETRYRDQPERLRTAAVYHLQNYHYRICAYRDKLAQLINACFDLGFDPKDVGIGDVLRKMRDSVEHRVVYELLDKFMKAVRPIIRQRHMIAHRALAAYQAGGGEWAVVTAKRRARDYFDEGITEEVERFMQVDHLYEHEAPRMRELTIFLTKFRYELARRLREVALRGSS
jgi:hypothetical protein